MAKSSVKPFFKSFDYPNEVNLIPIDDIPKVYAHTAILAKMGKTKNIKPLFGALHAGNKVQYAGKDLQFRQDNPKDFVLKKIPKKEVILIDDIVTTGTTLLEAKKVLEKNGVKVLFAVTVAS